jgi:hypothetical protein
VSKAEVQIGRPGEFAHSGHSLGHVLVLPTSEATIKLLYIGLHPAQHTPRELKPAPAKRAARAQTQHTSRTSRETKQHALAVLHNFWPKIILHNNPLYTSHATQHLYNAVHAKIKLLDTLYSH